MLSRIKKDGYKPLVKRYVVNLEVKDVPNKYKIYSNQKIYNEELIARYLNPFCYTSVYLVLHLLAITQESPVIATIAVMESDYEDAPRSSWIDLTTRGGIIYYYIPKSAFFAGLTFVECGNGIRILEATKEKAFLDFLYIRHEKFKDIDSFDKFFDYYRIDRDEFMLLDFDKLREYGKLYHSRKINLFIKYIKRGKFNFD